MGIEIRNATPDEFEAVIDTISTAFLDRPDARAVAAGLQGIWDPARVWVAWDGDRACGTFRSWATQLTVTGGARLPAAAVAAVTVLPTHRRRGILTRLAAAEHGALVERGEAVGLLYASEATIYGRFGYAPGTRTATWTLDARAAAVRGEPAGSLEMLRPSPETREILRAVHDLWRARQAGEIWRRDITWDLNLGLFDESWGERWKGWVVVHRAATGAIDGYVRYKAEEKWNGGVAAGEVTVNELIALGPAARADLVRYLVSIDLVARVKLEGRPESDPIPWLLANSRDARLAEAGDGMWVRLFDVPRALEARAWEREASLVLEVVDDATWGGTRRLHLDAGPGGATCRPTDRSPDLTLPVAALGGAYLGGTRLRDLVLATGADEHRAGALTEADALFRTADEPWNSTFF